MSTISGVAVVTISGIVDPMAKGRVMISLPGGTPEWAQVLTSVGQGGLLKIGDEVLVAFENGDADRPYVIGTVWQGSSSAPEQKGTNAVHLPSGAVLHPIAGSSVAGGSGVCATAADLERQAATWLASTECLMKVLALLKPLIEIVKTLPSAPTAPMQTFARAAAALQPSLLMNTPAQALPLVKDLLCLSLQSLQCAQASPPADQVQVAVGIQGVLDLGRTFFDIAGVTPIKLGVLTHPASLSADISAIEAVIDALGGCA